MTWAGVTPQRRPNKLTTTGAMKYHPDRKPGGAQNEDRDIRPTDAEAKESKNASSCQKSPSIAPLGTFESHSIDTDENSARLV